MIKFLQELQYQDYKTKVVFLIISSLLFCWESLTLTWFGYIFTPLFGIIPFVVCVVGSFGRRYRLTNDKPKGLQSVLRKNYLIPETLMWFIFCSMGFAAAQYHIRDTTLLVFFVFLICGAISALLTRNFWIKIKSGD